VADTGYATSATEAEEQAQAAIRSKYGEVAIEQCTAIYAAGVHRHEAIKRRASRKSSTTDAKETEYLYTDDTSDYDGHWYSNGYRIVKKTAKRVYIEDRIRTWDEDGQTYHDVETIALDRHKLEAEGHAYSKRCRYSAFFTTPWEARHKPRTPQCLEVLGLEGGADSEAITSAYLRLAKECHPDHGGNAVDFKRLQEAYETAMSSVA
jgi:hypothetical protein